MIMPMSLSLDDSGNDDDDDDDDKNKNSDHSSVLDDNEAGGDDDDVIVEELADRASGLSVAAVVDNNKKNVSVATAVENPDKSDYDKKLTTTTTTKPPSFIDPEPEPSKEVVDLKEAEILHRQYGWKKPDWVLNSPLRKTKRGMQLRSELLAATSKKWGDDE